MTESPAAIHTTPAAAVALTPVPPAATPAEKPARNNPEQPAAPAPVQPPATASGAVWAQVGECGATGITCERYTVRTQARVVERYLPSSLREVQAGARPSVTLDLSAQQARSGRAQFTYRVDGSLWSPWLSQQRLTLTDPLFLVQGHHLIEVAAREAGDDATTDPNPVPVQFFVSYEAPTARLTMTPDGNIVTTAHSSASKDSKLLFSYRIDGENFWSQPGPARVFTEEELAGHGLSVSVSDEAGRSAQAHFGGLSAEQLAAAGVTGCASSNAPALSLLALLGFALMRRQRKGSRSAG